MTIQGTITELRNLLGADDIPLYYKTAIEKVIETIMDELKREPSDDGTLEVKVEDATKIGRVLITDDRHRGGLYYPDEDEPQGISFENDTKIKSCSKDSDLISRADAIEAIELVDWYHQNSNKDMVHGANDDEHQAWYKAQDIYKALEAVPSADRPMVIKCKPFLSEEDFKAFAEQVSDQNVILIPYEAEVVSINTSTNTSTNISINTSTNTSTNISTDTSADRPKGRWHYSDGKPATIGQSFGVICDQCGTESEYCTNFCGECGADMRGEDE